MIKNAKDTMVIAELLRSKLDENGELHLPQEQAFALVRWVENAAKSQMEQVDVLEELIELRNKLTGLL